MATGFPEAACSASIVRGADELSNSLKESGRDQGELWVLLTLPSPPHTGQGGEIEFVSWLTYGNQRLTLRSLFLLSTFMWVLGVSSGPKACMASSVICESRCWPSVTFLGGEEKCKQFPQMRAHQSSPQHGFPYLKPGEGVQLFGPCHLGLDDSLWAAIILFYLKSNRILSSILSPFQCFCENLSKDQ